MSRLPTLTFTNVLFEVQCFDSCLQEYETTAVNPHMAFNTQDTQAQQAFQTTHQLNKDRGYYNNRFGSNLVRGGFSSRGRGFHQQNTSSGGSNTRPTCQICGRIGHVALKCGNRFDNNYQSGNEWFPDSGASAYITSTASGLQNATQYHGLESIMVADGNHVPITHVGSANVSVSTGSLPLNEVFACPSV